jgi:hypothetical protein
MLQHVMMFSFKDDADPATVAEVLDGIADFTAIPSVEKVAVSENRGRPDQAAPFTHGAILTFDDVAGRDAFFVNEQHVAVRERAMTVFGKLLTLSIES